MYKINNKFVRMLQTKVRDKETKTEDLQTTLYKLGEYIVSEIIGNEFVEEEIITTPLEHKYEGLIMMEPKIVVISTRDDYDYFASGISHSLVNCMSGYIDFGGSRGQDTYSSPIRAVELPEMGTGEFVDTVIIAKSVLATGCTAISLLRKATEKYMLSNIIISSVFYSEEGIRDIKRELRKCKIYVCGEPDTLNKKDMLIPGIGDIDERLKIKG